MSDIESSEARRLRDNSINSSSYQNDILAPVTQSGRVPTYRSKWMKISVGALVTVLVIGVLFAVTANSRNREDSELFSSPLGSASSSFKSSESLTSDLFDEKGRFILSNYDTSKPVSSFLPGIAGKFGTPIWAFYVNRGQGIASFGTTNKENPLNEFEPANKAYFTTPITGFRTFLKGKRPGKTRWYGQKDDNDWDYQPFFPHQQEIHDLGKASLKPPKRDMIVGMNDFELEEMNEELGLKTNVLYFTVPHEDFGGLVRRVTFTNTDKKDKLELEILDGLAQLIPFGVLDWYMKSMSRTLEAWMYVYNMEESENKVPWYRLTASIVDTEVVTPITEGNFAFSFIESDENLNEAGHHELLPMVVDPINVFGLDSTMTNPAAFNAAKSLDSILKKEQVTTSRTPSAFTGTTIKLKPGESITISSIYGHSTTLDYLSNYIVPTVTKKGFISSKREEADILTKTLTEVVATNTSSQLFDRYVQMDFLDNLLRGGFPTIMGDGTGGDATTGTSNVGTGTSASGTSDTSMTMLAEQEAAGTSGEAKVYYIFSRIHGDLERDYNYFVVNPTYMSQGPGNYRDVNQNRRIDNLIEPRVGDFNIRTFLSLVQADGYNPLTVEAPIFSMDDDSVAEIAAVAFSEEDRDQGSQLLGGPWRPGQLFALINKLGLTVQMDKEVFLDLAVKKSVQSFSAQYQQNGFWSDHWTYDMDLVDNYLAVFPDKEAELLFDSEPVPFYFSKGQVQPRSKKYVKMEKSGEIRQIGAVVEDLDKITAIAQHPVGDPPMPPTTNWQKKYKSDESMKVPLITKLYTLAIVKFAAMDPLGMAVSMEGGKPGWNDALNGLPALFGSGTPEMNELLRVLYFLRDSLTSINRAIPLHQELDHLQKKLLANLENYNAGTVDDFNYWDASMSALESYRSSVRLTFNGTMAEVPVADMSSKLDSMIAKVEAGVERATTYNDNGIMPTYFSWEATEFEETDEVDPSGRTIVKVKAFKPRVLPLFLEGPVRHLKVLKDKDAKRSVYEKVKTGSDLYDKELQMYKIGESLKDESVEIGRVQGFSAGWLENEAIWLHMSYKYYLELLRAGLHDEFWAEAKTGLVVFMDPATYGRSPLECSSFIASSAMPDERLHGSGYLARLSGSTAEFLSMWQLTMFGPKPFNFENNVLNLALQPAIPGWLFTEEGTVTVTFLGIIPLTYHNVDKTDTWSDGYAITKIVIKDTSGGETTIDGSVVSAPLSYKIRDRDGVTSIDAYFTSSS